MNFPSNRKPAMANDDGVLFDDKKKNQQAISEHVKSKAHNNIISNLQKTQQKSSFQVFS